MKTVLITGGIGSGKSVVCRYLEAAGIPCYDSDSRARALYDTDPALLEEVVSVFGEGVTGADGRIDRKALAAAVFSDKEKLSVLESMVHPAVMRDFMHWREGIEAPAVVFESAIALRVPCVMEEMDVVVLVRASEEKRVRRASERDSASEESVRRRIVSQTVPDDARIDFVIDNDGSLEELYSQIDDLFSIFA